jgi:hypothetical protein
MGYLNIYYQTIKKLPLNEQLDGAMRVITLSQ